MLNTLKQALEKISGCRIYRNTLPHGTEMFVDLNKALGLDRIKTVFDVGANIGSSALAYLDQFTNAQIYSFEPVEATFRKLESATRAHPRIHPLRLGMAREPGGAVIHVSPQCDRTSSIVHARPGDQDETIELETISRFAEKRGIGTIDFLKIDTEGYDLEVLGGAGPLLREQNIHLILIECEPAAQTKYFADFSAVAAFLKGFDYRLFGVYEQQPHWDGKRCLLYFNALFICEKWTGPH